jgi:hypothetical protein
MTTRANARITAALVIKDKVIVGAGNCGPGSANKEGGKVAGYSPPGGCFITGHDLETGRTRSTTATARYCGRARG